MDKQALIRAVADLPFLNEPTDTPAAARSYDARVAAVQQLLGMPTGPMSRVELFNFKQRIVAELPKIIGAPRFGLSQENFKAAWNNAPPIHVWAQEHKRKYEDLVSMAKYFRVDIAGNVVTCLAKKDADGFPHGDHKVPNIRGGPNEAFNLMVLQWRANLSKKDNIMQFDDLACLRSGVQAICFMKAWEQKDRTVFVDLLKRLVGYDPKTAKQQKLKSKISKVEDQKVGLALLEQLSTIPITGETSQHDKKTPYVQKKESLTHEQVIMKYWLTTDLGDEKQREVLNALDRLAASTSEPKLADIVDCLYPIINTYATTLAVSIFDSFTSYCKTMQDTFDSFVQIKLEDTTPVLA